MMKAEITATTQPFALKLARELGIDVPASPITHLLRVAPRFSWCGAYLKSDRFVPDWIDVTCSNCMTAINKARRQFEAER